MARFGAPRTDFFASRLALICWRGVLWGLVTSLVGGAPAAARLAAQGQPPLWGWLTVAGLLAVPSTVAVIGVSLARRGWRELVRGQTSELIVGLALWLALFCPIVFAAGAVLQTATHHRGLGGSALGAIVLVVGVGAALLALRWTRWMLNKLQQASQPLYSLTLFLASFSLVVLIGFVLRALPSVGLGWASASGRSQVALVDGSVWFVCVLIGAFVPGPDHIGRRMQMLLCAVGLALVVFGIALPASVPGLARAVEVGAPVAALVAQVGGLMQ